MWLVHRWDEKIGRAREQKPRRLRRNDTAPSRKPIGLGYLRLFSTTIGRKLFPVVNMGLACAWQRVQSGVRD